MTLSTTTRTETCGAYDCQKRFTVDSDRKADYLVNVKAPSGAYLAVALCESCQKKWQGGGSQDTEV